MRSRVIFRTLLDGQLLRIQTGIFLSPYIKQVFIARLSCLTSRVLRLILPTQLTPDLAQTSCVSISFIYHARTLSSSPPVSRAQSK